MPVTAFARTWTDKTGKYKIDADLIAFNDKSVVLQRADHELGMVSIDVLSQADQEYLKSKAAAEESQKIVGQAAELEARQWHAIGRARRRLCAEADYAAAAAWQDLCERSGV